MALFVNSPRRVKQAQLQRMWGYDFHNGFTGVPVQPRKVNRAISSRKAQAIGTMNGFYNYFLVKVVLLFASIFVSPYACASQQAGCLSQRGNGILCVTQSCDIEEAIKLYGITKP